MDNNSFVFYRSFAEAIVKLDPEECKACLIALCSYALDGEENASTPTAEMLLTLVKPQIDANEQRREAGRRGGKATQKQTEANVKQTKANVKQTEANTKQTKANVKQSEANTKQTKANVKQSEANANANVNVNANVKNPPTPFTVEEATSDALQTLGVVREVADKLSEWITSRREQGSPITETGLKSLVSIAKAKTKEHGAGKVAQLITECMASGYKGITWDRLEIARSGTTAKKGWSPEEKAVYGDMTEFEANILAN